MAGFQAVAVRVADRCIDLRAMEATLCQASWRFGLDRPELPGHLPVAADLGADLGHPLQLFLGPAPAFEEELGSRTILAG